MHLLGTTRHCPYCDTPLELLINPEDSDCEYIEDCQVCCQPIRILAHVDPAGELADLRLAREDD